jgi:gluconokinase
MVFIITEAAESGRDTVGRLLAEALGWEFVDAENLHPPCNLDARRCSTSLVDDPTLRIETLSAAIAFWIHEWRDVVVSCPMLTDRDQRQLSKMSSLVKIVCLEASHATGRSPVHDRSVRVVSPDFPAGGHAARQPGQDVLMVDSCRQVEEIVAEITAVLIMGKSPWFAHDPREGLHSRDCRVAGCVRLHLAHCAKCRRRICGHHSEYCECCGETFCPTCYTEHARGSSVASSEPRTKSFDRGL